jgi:membrane dipeptidase
MLRFLLCALLVVSLWAQKRSVTDAEVMSVHRSALLIDTHNDITGKTVGGYDIAKGTPKEHTDIARLKQGGVGAVFFAVYVASRYARENQSAHRALEMIDTVRHDIVERYPGEFMLARTADEILAARKSGKIAALMGIEGGHAIEDSPRLLRQFYNLGIRYITLTHSNTNNWADSSGDAKSTDVKHHGGLTKPGRELVREMNRIGMMVDISHVADDTVWDVLEISQAPVFASHSSCRALSNIARNMTDEMIVGMARKGGVIQINFGCEFVSQKSADASPWTRPDFYRRYNRLSAKEQEAENERLERESRTKVPRASIADVVAHIDHVTKIAGIQAVGIGTDYDGVSCVPVGLDDVASFPNLTRALLERGYSPAQIRSIYGGNVLRLMRAVEKQAGR